MFVLFSKRFTFIYLEHNSKYLSQAAENKSLKMKTASTLPVTVVVWHSSVENILTFTQKIFFLLVHDLN